MSLQPTFCKVNIKSDGHVNICLGIQHIGVKSAYSNDRVIIGITKFYFCSQVEVSELLAQDDLGVCKALWVHYLNGFE